MGEILLMFVLFDCAKVLHDSLLAPVVLYERETMAKREVSI